MICDVQTLGYSGPEQDPVIRSVLFPLLVDRRAIDQDVCEVIYHMCRSER